jgi:hypothetical protein
MRRLVFGLAVSVACALAHIAVVTGQQPPPPGLPTPRVAHCFPAGAKAGTTAEVTVSGFDFDDPTGLLFSHPGIKAEYLPPKEPEPDPKKKEKAPPKKGGKRNPNQADSEKFKVTVAANVPPGTYDLRLVGKWGVSNPRSFVVGDLAEVNEKEPNNDVPEAQRIEVGTTINGVIANGTDVDYAVFAGKKGQKVVLSCLASSIDSRAKPMIEVYGASGQRLATNRSYRENDAVADLTLPEDGDYHVRLFEFTYQAGSPEHFYRLSISAAPWIDAVFPPAVEFGKPAQVTLYGRNLPGGQPADGFAIGGRPLEKLTVTVTPPADPVAAQRLAVRDRVEPAAALQDGFEYRLKGPGGLSNAVPVYLAREKVVVKKAAAGMKPEAAEPITTPCEVAGMIGQKGERDWYSFEAKKGDVLYVELTGERNGAAADFYYAVYAAEDPAKKVPMRDLSNLLDDDPDALHPTEFFTRSMDPAPYKFTAPADGKYLVQVGAQDAAILYGPQAAYRLRVGPPKPDFRIVAKPYNKGYQTGSSARQDSTDGYEVYVHRIDGFTGAVTVTAEGLPAGVKAKPCVIGPAARWGVLVLEVAPSAAAFTGVITLKAASTLDGKPLAREVRPAAITWGSQPGQNIPLTARLTQSCVLAVRPEKGFFKVAADPSKAKLRPASGKEEPISGPIVARQGEKVTLPVKATWVADEKPNVQLAAEPMAQNPQQSPITVQIAGQPTKDKPEVTATIDVKNNAMPGVYSIVIRGDAQVPFVRDPMTKQKANLPTWAFTDPIEVTVLPNAVAKVTAGPLPNNQLKAGSSTELTIKVERQFDYAGEFKVAFVPAKDVKGVTAADIVIPAGKDETKLVLKVDDDAKPGAVAGVIVVTATYDKKYTITHETKAGFTVVPADKKKK